MTPQGPVVQTEHRALISLMPATQQLTLHQSEWKELGIKVLHN